MTVNFDHGGNVFAVARALGVAPEDILDFSASINPLGMAPAVKEALCSSLDSLLHYPDTDCAELAEALAIHHSLSSAHICIANGSTELIHLLPRLVKGARALIVAPPFSEYGKALSRNGWDIAYLELKSADGFALPLDILAARLKEGCDLLFLCNPGNPTGRLYSIHEIAAVMDICRRSKTFLVLDEAFMDFCEEGSAKKLVTQGERAVILRSMTKFFAMPGLRLGYAMGPEPLIAALSALRDPWSVNTLAQAAGIASLGDAAYIAETRRFIGEEREHLFAALGAIPGLKPYPSAANYILAEVGTGQAVSELQTRLIRERILIRDCANFHGLDNRFFRAAVRTAGENERLLRALHGALQER